MMFKKSVLVVMASLTVMVLMGAGEPKVNLRLKLRKGESYRQWILMYQEMVQTMSGRRQTSDQTVGFGSVATVQSVDRKGWRY